MKVKKYKISRRYESDIWGGVLRGGKLNKFYSNFIKFYSRRKKRRHFILVVEKEEVFKKKRRRRFGKFIFMKQRLSLFYGGVKRKYLVRRFKSLRKRFYKNLSQNIVMGLEMRIDMVLSRINFGCNIFEVRDMIKKGYFLLNRRVVGDNNILLEDGDLVEVVEGHKEEAVDRLERELKGGKVLYSHGAYVTVDWGTFTGVVTSKPDSISYWFDVDKSFFNKLYYSKL